MKKQELKTKATKLQSDLEVLEKLYESAGKVSWSEFKLDQKTHAGKVIELFSEDFQSGTLRIKQPCKLKLMESVQVNPNRPPMLDDCGMPTSEPNKEKQINPNRVLDWFPNLMDAGQDKEYGSGAGDAAMGYRLGFFACIAIEATEGTIVDLNGHTLEMHPEFALQQRFHAIVELADQPFVSGQGPAEFGELRSARYVWLKNGELGRSSHHCIHGNGMEDVLISSITFRNYEVAAISLSGGRRIFIEDCKGEGTRTDTPVLGTYSASRFIRLFANAILSQTQEPSAGYYDPLRAKLSALNSSLDAAFNEIIFGSGETSNPVYKNEKRITDGNTYGIALHARGVLVGSFVCAGGSIGEDNAGKKALETTDVILANVNLASTQGNIREILALSEEGKAPMVDTAGAVFQFFGTGNQPGNMDSDGKASLTELGAVQIELAKIKNAAPENIASFFGTLNIPPKIVEWSETSSLKLIQRVNDPRIWDLVNESDLATVLASYELHANGDSMHHVNKGVLNIFIQSVDGLILEDVQSSGSKNYGAAGSQLAGPYTGPEDGGHSGQNKQIGYGGADSRGVYIGACSDIWLDGVKALDTEAEYGSARGIEIAGASDSVEVQRCYVFNVKAGSALEIPYSSTYPNLKPVAVGIHISPNTEFVGLSACKVSGQLSQPGRATPRKVEILSETTEIELTV